MDRSRSYLGSDRGTVESHLGVFSNDGLRTLLLAKKELSKASVHSLQIHLHLVDICYLMHVRKKIDGTGVLQVLRYRRVYLVAGSWVLLYCCMTDFTSSPPSIAVS